jgi:hypothetical protein
LLNPVLIGGLLINFCGVLVPYSHITVFWGYRMCVFYPLLSSAITYVTNLFSGTTLIPSPTSLVDS